MGFIRVSQHTRQGRIQDFPKEGGQHTNLPDFLKKLHEIKEIVLRRGSATAWQEGNLLGNDMSRWTACKIGGNGEEGQVCLKVHIYYTEPGQRGGTEQVQ